MITYSTLSLLGILQICDVLVSHGYSSLKIRKQNKFSALVLLSFVTKGK